MGRTCKLTLLLPPPFPYIVPARHPGINSAQEFPVFFHFPPLMCVSEKNKERLVWMCVCVVVGGGLKHSQYHTHLETCCFIAPPRHSYTRVCVNAWLPAIPQLMCERDKPSNLLTSVSVSRFSSKNFPCAFTSLHHIGVWLTHLYYSSLSLVFLSCTLAWQTKLCVAQTADKRDRVGNE